MKKKHYILVLSLFVIIFGCKKNNQDDLKNYHHEGLSEGINYGIAANYINDSNLQSNEYVLGFENFENGEVSIYTEEDRYKNNVRVVQVDPKHGKYCAEHSWEMGYNGPTCRFPLPSKINKGNNPAYFIRMYLKFDESFHPYYNATPPASGDYLGVGVKGFGFFCEPPNVNTSEPCNGSNWFNAQCQFVGWGPSQKPQANNKYLWVGHLYSYNAYPNDAIATTGDELKTSEYRFSAYAKPFEYIQYNKWYCYELGLYLNTPGKFDGEARFWIDGILQSRTTHIKFRDIENLYPTHAHLNLHRVTENFPHKMKRYADNIVIATRYIGPMKQQ